MGINKFISPEINKKILFKTKKIIKNLRFKTKDDVIDFKIRNIKIGDLIYDTYLKKKRLPTIDLKVMILKPFLLIVLKFFFIGKVFLKIMILKQ